MPSKLDTVLGKLNLWVISQRLYTDTSNYGLWMMVSRQTQAPGSTPPTDTLIFPHIFSKHNFQTLKFITPFFTYIFKFVHGRAPGTLFPLEISDTLQAPIPVVLSL